MTPDGSEYIQTMHLPDPTKAAYSARRPLAGLEGGVVSKGKERDGRKEGKKTPPKEISGYRPREQPNSVCTASFR